MAHRRRAALGDDQAGDCGRYRIGRRPCASRLSPGLPALQLRTAASGREPRSMSTIVRRLAALFFVAHGVAHLVGFAASWQLGSLRDMTYSTIILNGTIDVGDAGMRVMGVLWVAAAVAFAAAAVAVISWLVPRRRRRHHVLARRMCPWAAERDRRRLHRCRDPRRPRRTDDRAPHRASAGRALMVSYVFSCRTKRGL